MRRGHIAAIDLYHGGGLGLTGTLPPELGDLDNLVALYLSKNNLSGSLPEELWDLERLVYLDLSDNLLEGAALGRDSKFKFSYGTCIERKCF